MTYISYFRASNGELASDLDKGDIMAAIASKTGLLWLDFLNPGEEDARFIEDVFQLHNLAIEDFASPLIHAPKIDDFGDYLFLITHGINYATQTDVVDTAELRIFLGSNFVISGHNDFLYSVEAVKNQVENKGPLIKKGADFLTHGLIDALIDNVLPTIDRMTEASADIEEEIINNPHKSMLEAIMKLKRSVLQIHRIMIPQREVLNRLSRGDFPIIKKETQIFYRDIYDHLVRISDLNQTNRDIADNALSTYLSSVANRQNEVMKVLTIVAVVFLPLSLIAGIYGMNFEYMPELKWHWGYFTVLGIMATAMIGLALKFWASSWITVGRKKTRKVISLTANLDKIKGFIGRGAKQP